MLRTAIGILDELLDAHAESLGPDRTAYRNHAYRVANLCLAQTGDGADVVEKVAVAAAFHDLGIWTDRTFDYLPPSVTRARAYLAGAGRAEWEPEITAMILEHHKLLALRGGGLVEAFRRADWIDVTRGLRGFSVPRGLVREVFAAWPDAGFHRRLLGLGIERLRTHPLSPLPMLRL
jgi:hypothetical protein